MENNSPTISPELQDKIEQEAIAKYPGIDNNIKGPANCHKYRKAFIAGATTYAHYKERCEELERWKREAIELLTPLLDYGQSKEAGIPLDKSIPAVILQRAKRFEQAKKALENLLHRLPEVFENIYDDQPLQEAKALLASWKEEGKEGDHEG